MEILLTVNVVGSLQLSNLGEQTTINRQQVEIDSYDEAFG